MPGAVKLNVLAAPDSGTFKDPRDNNVYKWKRFGDKIWSENMRYLPRINYSMLLSDDSARYYLPLNNFYPDYFNAPKKVVGIEPGQVLDFNYATATDSIAITIADAYRNQGALYNYPAALTACPEGWHLPTPSDRASLLANLKKPEDFYEQLNFKETKIRWAAEGSDIRRSFSNHEIEKNRSPIPGGGGGSHICLAHLLHLVQIFGICKVCQI